MNGAVRIRIPTAVSSLVVLTIVTSVASSTRAQEPTAAFLVEPTPFYCGDGVTFDAGPTDPGGDAVLTSIEWDFDDDGSFDDGRGQTVGPLVISSMGGVAYGLLVINSEDETDTEIQVLAPQNRTPTAAAGGPYVVDVGDDLVLDASSSSEPDSACGDSVAAYHWDFEDYAGDGGWEYESSLAITTVTWAELVAMGISTPGTEYGIVLQVQDQYGSSQQVRTTLVVYQDAPVACAQASPNPVQCQQNVGFDASCATHEHPHHSIVNYAWDWDGDGTNDDFGATAIHFWESIGLKTVRLTVWDDNVPPMTDTFDLEIVVNGALAPTAVAGGPYAIEEDHDLLVDASGSVDPDAACGDFIVFYEWRIDDEVVASGNDRPVLMIPWAALEHLAPRTDPITGEPTVPLTLRIVDSEGNWGTAQTSLAIYRNEPVARFSRSVEPAACGQVITFDASDAYHGSPYRNLTLCQWDWDSDGVYDETGCAAPHIFTEFGQYDVTLRVVDDNTPPVPTKSR